MTHQDLTTWFDSPAHVDETYIKVRPLLDDLSRFRQASLKDPCLRVSRRYNCHGISHPMNHQLSLCPFVVRPKNAFYFSYSFFFFFFFFF